MTKEELEKEAVTECFMLTVNTIGIDQRDVELAYVMGAEPREKQIQIDAEQIRALQKDKGELTDRVKELETSVSNLRKDNKELREVLPKLDKENDELKYKLTKAKEIIKLLLSRLNRLTYSGLDCEECMEAEQFLKETK